MKEQDYELLSQYLDGELETGAARELEQRLGSEPQLQAILSDLQRVNRAVKNAFKGTDTISPQVAAMLGNPGSRVVPFPRRRGAAAWQYAVAASLVAAAGLLLAPDWRQNNADYHGSAAGNAPLAQALEQAPSRGTGWETLSDGRRVRLVLSFLRKEGGWCREYLLSDQTTHWHGVACRTEETWVTLAISQVSTLDSPGEYRPAGAADSDVIVSFMDNHAADIPLSAAQESALIARDWQ
jgi:hypothetical protein